MPSNFWEECKKHIGGKVPSTNGDGKIWFPVQKLKLSHPITKQLKMVQKHSYKIKIHLKLLEENIKGNTNVLGEAKASWIEYKTPVGTRYQEWMNGIT